MSHAKEKGWTTVPLKCRSATGARTRMCAHTHIHTCTNTHAHAHMHAQNTCTHMHTRNTCTHMYMQCTHARTNTHACTVTLVPALSADLSEFGRDFAAWGPLSCTVMRPHCAFCLHLDFKNIFSFQKEGVMAARVHDNKRRRGAVWPGVQRPGCQSLLRQ